MQVFVGLFFSLALRQYFCAFFGITTVVFFICTSPAALADVTTSGTRIVYPEAKRDVSFTILNIASDQPAIVQMWIDAGDPNADPEGIDVPFRVSPPIGRVAASGRQTVRLTYTGEPLNPDQESLYWFNVLEIPSAFKGPSDADRVTFTRRSRIKLFFRPKGLKGDLQQAFKQMQCGVKNTEGDSFLECYNSSKFHLSFGAFSLGNASEKEQADEGGGMLKPLERARFSLKNYDKLPRPLSTVLFQFINDYGGVTPVEYGLNAP
jgi:P pilus assembly chaperone PapD